jgi:DNA-binding NtrC family response regulator
LRELRNVIERAVALCPGPEIGLDDLPERICSAAALDLNCSGTAKHTANSGQPASILPQTRQCTATTARVLPWN